MQTGREAGTQMTRPGVWIDDARDRWVYAQAYVTADQVLAYRGQMVTKIQCFVRCWLACRKVHRLRQARYEAQVAAMHAADAADRAAAEDSQREMERRLHPRTAADFAVLRDEDRKRASCRETVSSPV